MASPILDEHRWVKAAFLIPTSEMPNEDKIISQWTDAFLDFTDTTPGGSYEINPPSQFTRTADIKASSVFSRSKGKGRYYWESISANSQRVNFRMGVLKFNSLTQFFTGFYNSQASDLARTGRSTGAFYLAGRLTGFVVSIMSWQLIAIQLAGLAMREIFQRPASKFCYLKPAMHLYWNAYNTLVNQVAVYMGIIPRVGSSDDRDAGVFKKLFPDSDPKTAIGILNQMMPHIFRKDGGIDVFSMASRAQVLERKRIEAQTRYIDAGGTNNIAEDIRRSYEEVRKSSVGFKDSGNDFTKYLKLSLDNDNFKWKDSGENGGIPIVEQLYYDTKRVEGTDKDGKKISQFAYDEAAKAGTNETPPSFWERGVELFKAGLDDGAEFFTLRVNNTGTMSESFSNSYGEPMIKQTLNGISGSARSTWFSLANGNFAGDSVLGKMVGGITEGISNFFQGVTDQWGVSGIMALNGNAFVDIPDHWQNSVARLPTANYTVELTSPYAGNPIAYLLKIIIPLCGILAMTLPKSTGKQSYCEPFYLEYYDKGRAQSRLAAVESVSIRRGTTNLPYSGEGLPLGITVDIQLRDLSSVMHMPITQQNSIFTAATYATIGGAVGGIPGAITGLVAASAKTIFDEDTVSSDYLSTLSGLGLADNIYMFKKFKLKVTRLFSDWNSYTSPARYTTFATDLLPIRLLSSAWRGTMR